MQLHHFTTLPDGFLDIAPTELDTVLPGPSLIRLPGKQEPALFVSILLHGNEVTSLLAIQQCLRAYQHSILPRRLILFVGNVAATSAGMRMLPHQPDFNRIWKEGDGAEYRMTQEILAQMRAERLFASVDIHNNTGHNPHYACVNHINDHALYLASLFQRDIVFFTRPSGVQSIAFSDICPSITIECGRSGAQAGVDHAASFLDQLLHLPSLNLTGFDRHQLNVMHTVARIRIPDGATIAFGEEHQADFCFIPDFDHRNFTELPENTLLGWQRNLDHELIVTDEDLGDVRDDFFTITNHEIRLKRSVIPSMFTEDVNVIYQDCLGYLMQRYAV